MSKSILVLNTPVVCDGCILEQYVVVNHNGYHYCGACGIETKAETRLTDCPLKPLGNGIMKSGNKDFIIYERDYLYQNLEREIELLRKGKEYADKKR